MEVKFLFVSFQHRYVANDSDKLPLKELQEKEQTDAQQQTKSDHCHLAGCVHHSILLDAANGFDGNPGNAPQGPLFVSDEVRSATCWIEGQRS
jgi:hypothetical protein